MSTEQPDEVAVYVPFAGVVRYPADTPQAAIDADRIEQINRVALAFMLGATPGECRARFRSSRGRLDEADRFTIN